MTLEEQIAEIYFEAGLTRIAQNISLCLDNPTLITQEYQNHKKLLLGNNPWEVPLRDSTDPQNLSIKIINESAHRKAEALKQACSVIKSNPGLGLTSQSPYIRKMAELLLNGE